MSSFRAVKLSFILDAVQTMLTEHAYLSIKKSMHRQHTVFEKMNEFIILKACLQHLRWHRLNPGVCDFEVTVVVQKDLDGAWRHGAVLQNLRRNTTTQSKAIGFRTIIIEVRESL